MSEATNKDDPLRPLPNGVVPHPQDFVCRLEFMQPNGMHSGFIRVRAADGIVETAGFDIGDANAWAQIEKLNPAVVKLCRNQFEIERRVAHLKREMLNAHEAIVRGMDVVNGKRAPIT